MTVAHSTLQIDLIDDVTANAKRVAESLARTQKQAAQMEAALGKSGVTDRMQASLRRLGASSAHIDAVSNAWKDYAKSEKLAEKASAWTKTQKDSVKSWERVTVSALKAVQSEELAMAREKERIAIASERVQERAALVAERAQERAARAAERANRRIVHSNEEAGTSIAKGIAGAYVAHEVAHFAHQSLETYRDFDRERRYSQVVIGANDAQMEPLIRQAIHGSAISKYNDIQWLEGQRDLAARGYKLDQVEAFTPIAALIGQAFDVALPDGVKALEGAMLGFRKDVSTFDKAHAAAQRTADLEVKASKISGMGYEDIVQLYKFGAAPAQMSHLSEESMLAFGAISKKANMNGDESGTAFRALVKNLLSPTDGARTALMAAGIDFTKFQKGPRHGMNLKGFVAEVAQKYGVRLNPKTQAALGKIFANPDLLYDAEQFAPAVVGALQGSLKGKDAKSLKSIAGLATRFRDASVEGVDTNGLLAAIMTAISKNPALANAVFGSKQGGRIFAALGDPKFFAHIMDELTNHSQGFAQKVSDARMAGFDGAVAKFEGATKALEAAIGRAFDANGNGGLLTNLAQRAGEFVQYLAEADPHLQRLGVEAAGLAATFAGLKGAEALMGGFGLKSSATALTGAAEALTAAAGKIGTAGALEAAEGAAGAAGGLGRIKGLAGILPALGWVGAAIAATGMGIEALDWYKKAHPEDFNRRASGNGPKGHWEYHPTRNGRFSDPGKIWVPDLPDGVLHNGELNGPFRKWVSPPGRNHGSQGHWELDQTARTMSMKLGELSTTSGELVNRFAELSGATANLTAALASVGGSSGGGGGAGGGIINASYEAGGSGSSGGSGGASGGRGLGGAAVAGGGSYGGGGASADEIVAHAGGKGFNTRGVRNMNPGNIGWGPWARAHGATGWAGRDQGHGVAVFPSFDAGYAALGNLALRKYHGGKHSIDQLIAGRNGWTPGNHEAAKNVARMMGISPYADAHLDDPAMLERLKRGLSIQELGPAGGKFALGHRSNSLGLRNRGGGSAVHHDAAKLIEALNGGASPEIDHRSIKSYIAHLEYARSLHASMGGGGAYGRPRVAGLGAQMRGAFNHSGTDFG